MTITQPSPPTWLIHFLNRSIVAAIVPRQWKAARITPMLKVTKPVQPSEFRPILITPVLSRILERQIVKSYIYPALQQPPPGFCFSDQFTFRPTDSTAAALIALLQSVWNCLPTHTCISSLWTSPKAFDTVWHATVTEKMMQLSIPDQVYNWIKNFFHGHSHCTKFAGSISKLANIMASVIQGCAIGPAAYLITAANMCPIQDTNRILKFTDDTCQIVPAVNTMTYADELSHIESWATENNLKLNCTKTKEIIFQSRSNRGKAVQLPPPQQSIEHVDKITTLGRESSQQSTIGWQQPITSATSWQHVPASPILFVCFIVMAYLSQPSVKDASQASVRQDHVLLACTVRILYHSWS